MEQNLFRPENKNYNCKTDEISITGLKNPREELRFVARKITELVRKEGYCYKEIAVVTGDVAQYANYVPEIFEQFEIPFFVDQTKNVLFHPFTECLRAILEIVEQDFSYASVFRFLRCNLTGGILKETPEDGEPLTGWKTISLQKESVGGNAGKRRGHLFCRMEPERSIRG